MTTRAVVPRSANEGSIGTASKPWGAGHFNGVLIGGESVRMKKIFEASGTFIVPAGVTRIFVSGCGGGGGGSTLVGCGGGGGESILRKAFNVTPKEQISITIGAGGMGNATTYSTAAPTTYNLNGTDGGDTLFGSYIILKGGKGGINSRTSTTDSTYHGGLRGGFGATSGEPNEVTFITPAWDYFFLGGAGGSSLFGVGGTGGSYDSGTFSSRGEDGVGFGAGGGGGAWKQIKSVDYTTAAGSGTNGIIMIEWD